MTTHSAGAVVERGRALRARIASAVRTWGRRTLSITSYTALCLIVVMGLPVLLALAMAIDLVRGGNRAATARCVMLAAAYLLCEVGGLIASAAVWIVHCAPSARAPENYLAVNYRLQGWWASALYGAATRLFAMRVVVEGEDAVRRAPFVLFCRHVSIGDTLLPAVLIGARHAIRLRYIMKRELLWDPCLDVVGNRLPNRFVRRGAADSAREICGMQRLAEDLGPRDAVLIYPEGTFFSEDARLRALAHLRQSASAGLLEKAARMRRVLPPRLGGALALLERSRDADAVFCAHTGFEGADTLRALLNGVLIGRTVRVHLWRVPHDEIPIGPAARAAWLYDQWLRVDAVVAGFTT